MRKIIISIFLLLAILFMTGCPRSDVPVDIYTSIYPLEFLTKEIVKDELVVKSLYPRGAAVHDYEPPVNVILKMNDCKAVFYIGSGLEAFIENAKETNYEAYKDKFVELSLYINMLMPDGTAPVPNVHSHAVDPHIWLDPIRMSIMADKILEKLIELYPDKAQTFTANATDLNNRLYELDSDFRDVIDDPSVTSKMMVVDHDAYVYWQDRYGLKRIKTRFDNESCEIIPSGFAENIKLIKDNKIKYIVITANESQCPIIEQYKNEADLEIVTLHNIATITKNEDKAGMDYIESMYNNLSILKKILPKNN